MNNSLIPQINLTLNYLSSQLDQHNLILKQLHDQLHKIELLLTHSSIHIAQSIDHSSFTNINPPKNL